jgi:putative ABC transport system permease protein
MNSRGIGIAQATQVCVLLVRSSRLARVAYLALTIAVTVAGWFVLAALASPFVTVKRDRAVDSIVVNNARSARNPLPVKYAARLAAIQGVASVDFIDLQMLECGSSTVTVNALGWANPDDASRVTGFDRQAVKRWTSDPLGALVSQSAASLCGWRLGQGIEPPDIRKRPIPLHVSGIATARDSDPWLLAHYDYINNQHPLVAGKGRVLKYEVQAVNPADNSSLAARIETAFAHDDPPVTAYPDTAREDARTRLGKVQYLVALVMGALFMLCLLVLASVMAHAAVERRDKLGMLRVLGFPRRILAAGYVLEVIAIIVVGAGLGSVLGQLVLRYLPNLLQGQLLRVAPAPWAWTLLPVWLALLAALSLLYPCLLAARSRPLDCQER